MIPVSVGESALLHTLKPRSDTPNSPAIVCRDGHLTSEIVRIYTVQVPPAKHKKYYQVEILHIWVFKLRAPPQRQLAKVAYLSHHAIVVIVVVIVIDMI